MMFVVVFQLGMCILAAAVRRGKIISTPNAEKLSFTEKVGHSLADGAAQFVFLTTVNYQAGFYTDALGIRAADASWLVLIARLWDAFLDPMMGFVADRTHALGPFPPVDSLVDYSLACAWCSPTLCLRYGRTGPPTCTRGDQHRTDDRLFHEQHALFGADGGNDRRPER